MEAEEKDASSIRKKTQKDEATHKLNKTASSDSVSTKHRKHHKDKGDKHHKVHSDHSSDRTARKMKSNGSSRHNSPNPRREDSETTVSSPHTPTEHHLAFTYAHHHSHGQHQHQHQHQHGVASKKSRTSPHTSMSSGDEAIVLSQHHHLSKRLHAHEEERARDLEEEVEKLEELVVDDAEALFHQFDKAFGEVAKELQRPNVLLTGITGAGKSTLINAVFGKKIAATGTGVPITQHFTKYESKAARVVIYDSKGLEHGHYEDFIESTNEFFESHKTGGTDAIHVIWYIINSAHSRFEPFEETICRKLFNKVPLLFVLNKADLSSKEDREGLRQIIQDMDLPNCVGVLDVVASPNPAKVAIEACPKCGSDDIIIKKRQGVMECESCNYTEELLLKNGLEAVIEATTNALPVFLRVAFVSAQTVSFVTKEKKHIIMEFWKDYLHVRTPATLTKVIAKMMAKLCLVWEFKKHGKSYGVALAQETVASLGWKDKLGLFLHNKDMDSQRSHSVAIGILWNQCLRTMAYMILKTWSETRDKDKDKDDSGDEKEHEKYIDFFSAAFVRLFTDENLQLIESKIEEYGIEWVLSKEIHNEDGEVINASLTELQSSTDMLKRSSSHK